MSLAEALRRLAVRGMAVEHTRRPLARGPRCLQLSGAESFSGLMTGRLLNHRLLVDGSGPYRDQAKHDYLAGLVAQPVLSLSYVIGFGGKLKFALVGDGASYSSEDAERPPLFPGLEYCPVAVLHLLITDLPVAREVEDAI